MSTSLIDSALQELEKAFSPLFSTVYSEQSQHYLLEQLGFPPDSAAAASLETAATSIINTFGTVRAAVQQPAASLEELMGQAGHFVQLIDSLNGLATLFAQLGGSGGVADLAKELVGYLFGTYLSYHHTKLYRLLVLLEIVEDPRDTTSIDAVVSNGTIVRYRHSAYQVHFDRISALITDPKTYFKAAYYPQGLPNRVEAHRVADNLFPRLGNFLATLGFDTEYGFRDYGYLDYGAVSNELMKHTLTVQLNSPKRSGTYFGFTLALSSAQDGDLGLVVAPYGAARYEGDFGRWVVEVLLMATLDGLSIGPQGVLLSDPQASFSATARVERTADEAGNAFLFGAPEGTYLAIGQVSFQAGVQTSGGQADYGVLAKTTQARFVLRPEGSSFLKAILPASGAAGTFDLGMGWSKNKGFYLLGSAGLKAHYTVPSGVLDRLLVVRGVDVELAATTTKLQLKVSASGRVKLGPVQAELTDVGAVANITFPSSGGNLGIANAEVAFKTPTGIGITVDSDLLTGGGYLFLDPATHTYAGAANLTLQTASREINLTALGILQTQLPGQPDAYSLVLLITAQFSPIELGLGFTLNGLGGLIGVNRRADTSFLLSMVRRGELDKLLFPANVLDDPAGALALLDGAFPATDGRYVIGLLGELGWGLPNIITLDVALLLEFPAPLQVIILGVLQALLPTRQNDVLKLRAGFIGSVDFGAKKVRFDAFLSDSHILDFSLTGAMAFRLYQGANPLFLLAAGGFHPQFQPPAGAELGTLHRITLALSRGNLELTLAAYFAVTSNTVQFGAHLDLVYGISHGFRVEGHFSFDALFQLHPFQVLLHVAADVAIKAGNHELLSVHLDLAVAGPGPWYIQGEASFRILFFRVGFRVNATIGNASPKENPPLPPNAHAPLVAALQDPASWSVEAPAPAARPGGVVLRPVGATAGQLFIDPRGALVVRQRVAPLGIELQKFGSSNVAPIGGRHFDLLGLVLGEGANQTLHAGPDVEAIKDFFAPDQYRVLTDGQKLSLPSLQSLPGGLRLSCFAGR